MNTFRFVRLLMLIICISIVTQGQSMGESPHNHKPEVTKHLAPIIRKAVGSGARDIYIPAGLYTTGPYPIDVPPNTILHGDGKATVIKLANATAVAFNLGAGSTIDNLVIDGSKGKSGGVSDGVVLLGKGADGASINRVSFVKCVRSCIVTDHANGLTIQQCSFDDIAIAISIQFSNDIRILNNNVTNASLHGIQYWGNWKWESRECGNILISGNHVKNGGEGAIWGAGADNVIIIGNIVDGAKDVGIDLEWCTNSVVSGNVVSNFENGGISLFFSCTGISINGNTIINNREIKDADADWWARSGIWLTYTNTEVFPNDVGHRDINITGNTILCEEGDRRAIWVGSSADNITIANNTINKGGIWTGGGTEPMQQVSDGIVIRRQ